MSQEEYRRAFSRKLQYYMHLTGKTQADIIADLGFQSGTVSMWVNGKRLPRMDKIEMLARYFRCAPSDLYEEKNDGVPADALTAAILEKINKMSEEQKHQVYAIVSALEVVE